jgi:hypothetical protein
MMNNLIYLSLPWLSSYDPRLVSENYIHHRWFRLSAAEHWPAHTTSRVDRLETPWTMAPTVCPIPTLPGNSAIYEKFDWAIESIAEEFCRHVQTKNLRPYVCWSGGIDSTAILVSLLKVAPADILDQLVVLHSYQSVQENSYFYHTVILPRLKTQDIDQFAITSENYDKIVIVDGEAGNQVFGATSINKLIYSHRFDLLDQPWRQQEDLKCLLMGATDFNIELVVESIGLAPVPVETGCDFLWWYNFNFKFDDVLVRKMVSYAKHLNPTQTKVFWNQGLYRFYSHDTMQIWSMTTQNQRRESSKIMPKYIPKKYIFDFDHNDFWYASKGEQGSSSDVFFSCDLGLAKAHTHPVFALDSSWNKYSIADASTRVELGKILQRN